MATTSIERIANDVLSLSRIQLQVLSISPVEFELVPEVEKILALFRNELKMWVLVVSSWLAILTSVSSLRKQITLSFSIGESLSTLGINWVKADKARFAQVV